MISVLFLRLVLSLLVLQSLGLCLDEGVVVAAVQVEALTVEVQNVGGNCVEKLAVVRHCENCRRPRLIVTTHIHTPTGWRNKNGATISLQIF